MRRVLGACALLVVACARPGPTPLSPRAFPFAVDSVRSAQVRPGAVHHAIWSPAGPWVTHVLDVRLDRCWTAKAVKGGSSAIGRQRRACWWEHRVA